MSLKVAVNNDGIEQNVPPANILGVGLKQQEVLSAARVLTADDCGKVFLLALAGGLTVTLPANSIAGFHCQFRVTVAPTTAYIIAAATADTMAGSTFDTSGGASDTEGAATGDQLNLVANVALIGDRVDIYIDGVSVHAQAWTSASGGATITG